MVSIFVCCWLPLNVINVTNEYVSLLYESRYFLLTFFAAHVVAMSSTVYNPFLYADPTRPAPPRRKPRLSCVRACVRDAQFEHWNKLREIWTGPAARRVRGAGRLVGW